MGIRITAGDGISLLPPGEGGAQRRMRVRDRTAHKQARDGHAYLRDLRDCRRKVQKSGTREKCRRGVIVKAKARKKEKLVSFDVAAFLDSPESIAGVPHPSAR